jgi:subtilase family serine protease
VLREPYPLRSILHMRGALLLLLVLLICTTSLLTVEARGNHRSGELSYFARHDHAVKWISHNAPTDSSCRQSMKLPCYSPSEMRTAYGVKSMVDAGITGKGQTIVIIDSYGNPTVSEDLKQFDRDYNLPDPPSFRVIAPLGTKPFDVKNADMVGWAQETDLDVQWAHAIAPGANIVLLTSPVSETQGVQGMPEFAQLVQYALDNHLGSIISQSWGTTENTLFTSDGYPILDKFNSLYQRAMNEGVTVLASAGDTGVQNPDTNNKNYPFPTVDFPASSPYVTAVGGTTLNADTQGNYQSETAWNGGAGSATGGGFSQYFKTPDYQTGALGAHSTSANGYRGLPDVAYDADASTGVPIYLGFASDPGYYLFGGTSAGAPQWAGLIAIGNQIAGRSLGFINPDLYAIGKNSQSYAAAFHDITVGNNSQGGVQGYKAGSGWDPVSGWGSPQATVLIASLINQHMNRLAHGNTGSSIRTSGDASLVHRLTSHRMLSHKAHAKHKHHTHTRHHR